MGKIHWNIDILKFQNYFWRYVWVFHLLTTGGKYEKYVVMSDCNYRFFLTGLWSCTEILNNSIIVESGSVLNYEVVLVWSSTPAGGQSGPIVFPCVPGSRLSSSGVKKTTNSGDPDGCVQHELLPSNLFILRGRAWYYNVLNELPGWSLLSLYDDFIQKQTLYVQLLCFHIFEQINPLLYW